MRVSNKQLQHGAVLYQIAEHPQFTAINALKLEGHPSNNAFLINDDIAVYPKISSQPAGRYKEYRFTFDKDTLQEIAIIDDRDIELHLALVCVQDSAICCLSYDKLKHLIDERRQNVGREEEQYQVLVMYEKGKSFRVNMNLGGTRDAWVGRHILVSQNACPNDLFRPQDT